MTVLKLHNKTIFFYFKKTNIIDTIPNEKRESKTYNYK